MWSESVGIGAIIWAISAFIFLLYNRVFDMGLDSLLLAIPRPGKN